MFGAPSAAVGEQVEAAQADPRVVELASRVPGHLRFGTSSWSFPGWKNIVYKGENTTQDLSRLGLPAYSAHPLLKTVGVDRSFYGPVRADEFARYAEQVGEDFRFLVKAHGECTLARFGHDKRWGDRAGKANERFLNTDYARELVVEPFVEGLGAKGGGPPLSVHTSSSRSPRWRRGLCRSTARFFCRASTPSRRGCVCGGIAQRTTVDAPLL